MLDRAGSPWKREPTRTVGVELVSTRFWRHTRTRAEMNSAPTALSALASVDTGNPTSNTAAGVALVSSRTLALGLSGVRAFHAAYAEGCPLSGRYETGSLRLTGIPSRSVALHPAPELNRRTGPDRVDRGRCGDVHAGTRGCGRLDCAYPYGCVQAAPPV